VRSRPASSRRAGAPASSRRASPGPRRAGSARCAGVTLRSRAFRLLLAAQSIGGGAIGLRLPPRHPLRVAFLIFLIATPTLIAAHAPLGLIGLAAPVDGSTGALFNVFWFTALQSEASPGEHSGVISWDYPGSLALQPAGQLVSGPIDAAVKGQ